MVRYDGTTGRPTDISGALYGWVSTPDGSFVANEPEGASTWYPVNDHPTDKATYRFRITVPAGSTAVANGELLKQIPADGWTTFVWRATDPMASYLSTASIGDYDLRTSIGPRGLPIIDAVDRYLAPGATDGMARTAEMIAYFTDLVGEYPFTSYGRSSTTTSTPGTRWKPRPVRSTPVRRPSRPWPTNSPTSGSATASARPAGRTSGSTRGSRPTPSGSGRSMPVGVPFRSGSMPSTPGSGWPASGTHRRATRAPRRCSPDRPANR